MNIGLGTIQVVLLVLWYTLLPTMPAWLVFLPLMIIGVVFGLLVVLPVIVLFIAAFIAACFSND